MECWDTLHLIIKVDMGALIIPRLEEECIWAEVKMGVWGWHMEWECLEGPQGIMERETEEVHPGRRVQSQ